jgi:aldose 1-epimerase
MKIIKQQFGKFQEYVITNPTTGESVHILPEYGANVHRLILQKNNQLFTVIHSGDIDEEFLADPSFPSAILFPWPNRIQDGQYDLFGSDYYLPINEVALNHAIHGFVYDKSFEVVEEYTDANKALVVLRYDYQGDYEGYPFPFVLDIMYQFRSEDGLLVKFSVKNKSEQDIPIGLGWHPYFQINGESADEWKISFPATHQFISDARMIPDVRKEVESNEWIVLKDRTLDNVFLLDKKEIATVKLHSEKSNVTLIVWQPANWQQFNYSVLYVPPKRDRIAIEPMTCNTNAFNTGDGLLLLPIDGLYEIECGVYLN